MHEGSEGKTQFNHKVFFVFFFNNASTHKHIRLKDYRNSNIYILPQKTNSVKSEVFMHFVEGLTHPQIHRDRCMKRLRWIYK